MIRSDCSTLQPTRPVRNARRYSTTWKIGSARSGSAIRTTRAVPHLAAVDDAHDAARRDRLVGALHERLDDAQQRVVLDDRVGVDGAEQRVAAQVDPGVQRVGLPALVLVDHEQVRSGRSEPYTARTCARGDATACRRGRCGAARRPRRGARSVPSVEPSLIDDDLELAVVDHEQRAHRLDDRLLLVVRGHEDRDRPGHVRLHDLAVVGEERPPHEAQDLAQRDQEEAEVDRVQREEVDEHEDVEPDDGAGERGRSSSRPHPAGSCARSRSSAQGPPHRGIGVDHCQLAQAARPARPRMQLGHQGLRAPAVRAVGSGQGARCAGRGRPPPRA